MRATQFLGRAGLISAIFVASQAAAADFRVLDYSASCQQVASLESARGSTVFEGKLPSGYQFAFRTREMDRDAVVAYACRKDQFFRGAYIFEASDEGDASRLYEALKKRVTSELGKPDYDFASAEHRKKMSDVGATLARRDTQVAFWKAKSAEAHASVGEPSGDRGWWVSLSYTANSALE